MKVLENKSIFKKLIIVFLCILLLSFLAPNIVKAVNDEIGIGGKLLDPVMSMFVGLGDGAITLLQKIVLHTDGSMIEINSNTSGIAKVLGIVVAVTIVVVGVIAVVASGGTALSIVGGVLTVLKNGVIAGVITYCVSGYVANAVLPEDFVLPQIKLSPYEIFANQVPVFDVDFFNPSESTYVDNRETYTVKGSVEPQDLQKYIIEKLKKDYGYKDSIKEEDSPEESTPQGSESKNIKVKTWDYQEMTYRFYYNPTEDGDDINRWTVVRYLTNSGGSMYQYLSEEHLATDENGASIVNLDWKSGQPVWNDSNVQVYVKTEDHTYTEGEIEEIKSTASELQGTISNWYTILRDMSLVALLSILVYVGIRIIISSTSNDKAKYKQMLVDWIVAICLLFIMHYIMAFSNLLVKKVIDVIDATDVVENAEELPEGTKDGTLSEEGVVVDRGPQLFEITQTKQVDKAYEVLVKDRAITQGISQSETEFYGNFKTNEEGQKVLLWPANNFTEQARMMLQLIDATDESGNSSNNYAYASIGYKLIYCVLVIYTIIFAFTYFKRTVYMAFLTLIAPLVALTYPIDKMNDGQAQAFNKWFKEYIFNLLIQPLHLILYMVLIGSAMDFASQNIIYVVVALGFMTQGEKLLRSFFGFEKAHTPGFLAGPAGAAMMMSGVNKLLGRSPRKGGKGSKELGGSSSKEEDNRISYKDSLDTADLFGTEDGNDRLDTSSMFNNDERNHGLDTNEHTPLFSNQNDSTLTSPDYRRQNEDYYNGNYMRRFSGNSGGNIRQIGNNSSNTSRFQRRTLRGLKNVGSKIRMKAANEHTVRKLAGVGTGLLGAGAAATAAGIIGITSGDVSKAAQYMGAGAIGGYKLANDMPQGLNDLNNSRKEYTEAFKEGYYTDAEYQEKQIKNKIKEAKKDEELRRELERRLGDEDAKMAIDTVSADCIRYGLGNSNEIAATYQRVQSGENIKDALMQVKFVNEYGKDTSKLGHKDSEDLNATIMDRVRKNSRRGTSEREMQEHARKLRENFDATSKIVFKKL